MCVTDGSDSRSNLPSKLHKPEPSLTSAPVHILTGARPERIVSEIARSRLQFAKGREPWPAHDDLQMEL